MQPAGHVAEPQSRHAVPLDPWNIAGIVGAVDDLEPPWIFHRAICDRDVIGKLHLPQFGDIELVRPGRTQPAVFELQLIFQHLCDGAVSVLVIDQRIDRVPSNILKITLTKICHYSIARRAWIILSIMLTQKTGVAMISTSTSWEQAFGVVVC